ncbi:MAG: hypothetical protein KF744_02545 [Taibaiella sp.]|nr:hypothetical protein [Taibaiella sp.]
MVSKHSGWVFTVIGVLAIIFSVSNFSSCTKPLEDNPYSCNYVICSNGGRCDSGRCVCPLGYEGADCSVKTVKKFYGMWETWFINLGSDSSDQTGTVKHFDMELKPSASLSTFFIYNFDNNSSYNNVLCRLDSADHSVFVIDTSAAQNMYYDSYKIRGGWGTYYADSITGMLFTRRLTTTYNWRSDTFKIVMRKR